MPTNSIAFDRASGYYDETRGFPPGEEKNAAALLVKAGSLTAESRVLEIGIGTGRIALPLSAHVHAVYGLDIARPMMNRLRVKQEGEPVFLAEASATQLPFPADSFDAVVAVHVFHLIAGWRDVLSELKRVLKKDAPLLHAWTGRYHIEQLWDAWRAALPANQPAIVGVSWAERETFLGNEGWRRKGDEYQHIYTHRQSPAQFLESVRERRWSNTWPLTDDELNAGIAAIQAVIAANFEDPSQTVEIESGFHVRAYLSPE